MFRRRFLLALGVGTGAVVAGCVSGDGPASTPAGSPSATTDAPATPTVDAPFPPGRDDVDEVRWYRQISNPDAALVLEPSSNAVSLPDAEASFALTNETDRDFLTNFYDWALYRWESGRWHRVAPTSVPQPAMSVPSGESHIWTLTVDNGDLAAPEHWTSGTSDLPVSALGGGRYAFAVDGWWPDQEATPTHEHQTVRAVQFEIEGDLLPLEPSRAVTDVSRKGDTVVVSAENPSDDGSDYWRPATFVLTRDEEATDPRRFVTEQVYRQWPLRDALANAGPDAETVRVETTTDSSPPFGVQDDQPPIRYEGRTYRVSADARGD